LLFVYADAFWLFSIRYSSGDISENDRKVVDSCMQIMFIAWDYPPPFSYLQEGSG
jgi:hypothetical protein